MIKIISEDYSNKSFTVGKKPMCKNCAYYIEHWAWLGVFRYCNADGHEPKNARCRCTNGQFKMWE